MSVYVPILITDAGRLEGLAATPDAAKDRLTPLLDVTAPPRGRPLAAHLDGLVDALGAALGARCAFADARDAGAERGDCARVPDGRVHLAYLLDAARARGLALVPVTGLRRVDAYQLAVGDAADADGRGVALRLERPDFRDVASLAARAFGVLDALGVAPADADLVLDFGGVTSGHVAAYGATGRAVLAALVRDVTWRSVTVAAATQLPADARGLARGPRAVPRTDWLLWRALTANADAAPGLARYAGAGALRFGDYGPLLYGPHPVRPNGAVEWVGYAHGAEWIVRDAAGDAHRDDAREDARDARRVADARWGEGRRAFRALREPSAAAAADAGPHARPDAFGPAPAGGAPWPGPGAVTAWSTGSAAAGDLSARRRDPAACRGCAAAAVTHHLTVAVEQLAPSPRSAGRGD